MKRFFRFLIVLAIVIGIIVTVGVIALKNMEAGMRELLTLTIEDVDLALVPDGTYAGDATVLPVSVEVNVTVVNHQITAIEIVKHFTGQGQSAVAIVEDVIAENSLEVDVIAGATYSSKVILLAIQDALLGATE